jgi:hypothetical protein
MAGGVKGLKMISGFIHRIDRIEDAALIYDFGSQT